MSDDAHEWESRYMDAKPGSLPWDAGGPDPDLARLVEAGRIPVGRALDIGTGPGHDAVYLIQQGFDVIGIDISPSAVLMARENASRAGVFGFFSQGDVRQLDIEDALVGFVNDRGCLHVLSPADRDRALSEIHRVLTPKGLYLLRVFSDRQPPGPGPHRFSRSELDALAGPRFRVLEFWEGTFQGPAQAKSYSMLLEKK